jgi:hypothetical protein
MSQLIFGMASLQDKRTGLGNIILWASPKFSQHGPRIKVSNVRGKMPTKETELFSLSISDKPVVVAGTPVGFSNKEKLEICKWISLNKIALLDYWENRVLTEEFLDSLKPL